MNFCAECGIKLHWWNLRWKVIGYLENILIKNRISFGSEFSGVA